MNSLLNAGPVGPVYRHGLKELLWEWILACGLARKKGCRLFRES